MSKARYDITIKTGMGYQEGNTDANVFIKIVGENTEDTAWELLDNFWRDDFEQGRIDKFSLEMKDVGRPLVIHIELKDNEEKQLAWTCDYITVKYKEDTDEFPVYEWIEKETSILRGDAVLPQNVSNAYVRKVREDGIKKNRQKYEWVKKAEPGDKTWMLPRFVDAASYDDLPRIFQKEDAHLAFMEQREKTSERNAMIELLQDKIMKIDELDDYKNLFSYWKMPGTLPPYIEKWQEDEEMGRQMLDGVNPGLVSRCVQLPAYCNITNEHVVQLLKPGSSLEKEIAAGRIYIMDNVPITTGAARNTQAKTKLPLFCPDTTALFYSPENGKFRPIAIQLEPENPDSIFTASDSRYDWMLAKMYYRCGDGNIHEWVSHFLYTHGAMEPITTSLFRCLPRSHPIYKLLRPNLRAVVSINQLARDDLIFPDSSANNALSITGSSLASKAYETFDFNDLNIPEKLKKNDVLDKSLLPNYHYRDDCLMLWGIVEKYVEDIITYFYSCNQDVTNDFELQGWIKDIGEEGFGWMGDNTRGCPTSFEEVKQLVTFCTIVIFTSSVQHAATNFAQFDIYKFIPNAPTGMRKPIHKKGEGDLQRVLDSLPDVLMSTLQLGTAYTLSSYLPNEVFLGEFPEKYFTEPRVLHILEQFSHNLKEAEKKIMERNKSLEFPYEYLLPSRIPSSISI